MAKFVVASLMGFAGGVPLLLTLTIFQAWLTAEGVDLATIGFLALVGLPYNLKFLWAPLMDRYVPPLFGRRRGWLICLQGALALALVLFGSLNPSKEMWLVGFAAVLVAFLSASQDVVIDAYRREQLSDDEQGLGAAFYTYGYRFGMLVAGGGGLIAADVIGFKGVYFVMAGIMAAMILVTVLVPEPTMEHGRPASLGSAFTGPFKEFFGRGGREAMLVLVFIVLFKLGDNLASHMTIPFYLATGFSNADIGYVVKLFGFWALVAGTFLGGALVLKLKLYKAMWVAGILQAVSTLGFAVLAIAGPDLWVLAAVIAFENFSMGLGTTALLAFMAQLTDRRFTATQFALLSSLTALARTVLSAPTGIAAEYLGWVSFFTLCALIAIPGLLLLAYLSSWFGKQAASAVESATP
ncbi:MAG: AmpG family muropeptide MFS transporter [Gammaproteobacteria bacterium]